MGSITAKFQSESALHPAAAQFLHEAFSAGWADPTKIHQSSRKLLTLVAEARQIFARELLIREDEINFLGEPALGFLLGINGLQYQGSLLYPATSRAEVLAIAESKELGRNTLLPVDLDGNWRVPIEQTPTQENLLVWQNANIETGAISSDCRTDIVFADCTATPLISLPEKWDAALWDSKSWMGPAGLSIFAVKTGAAWQNPLPHFDQRITPGGANGFNAPLAIASAIALEHYRKDFTAAEEKILRLNSQIRSFLQSEITDVDIASPLEGLPHLLSFSILYVDAEQLVDQLDQAGFEIDSGSACTSANLQPSHVLAAMGRLTQGNVRLTLRPTHTDQEVSAFLIAVKDAVLRLRS